MKRSSAYIVPHVRVTLRRASLAALQSDAAWPEENSNSAEEMALPK